MNAAPIPSVRTLMDFKLGVFFIGDWSPWNFIGVPLSLVFCNMSSKIIDLLMMKEERI
ncbi:hypothetical protein B296_00047336 [Ensete ventricosum]|uniref:Uncharacterized protein n=1 Tax=Ensete ventricosum TaxID=4639 RepID=A0A426X2L9_ENSVE|nr:hypothetical protein B296_00047336 [Ensete ventricosum]